MQTQQLLFTVYLLHGMRDLPGPGVEPVSLALQGGFFTTGPPEKPQFLGFIHRSF